MPSALLQPDKTWSLPQVIHPAAFHPTSIEWCDFSSNFLRAINRSNGKIGWACTKVSEACADCYAEAVNMRYGAGQAYTPAGMKEVDCVVDEQRIQHALSWRIPRMFLSKNRGSPQRPLVFVADMTDLFGEWVTDEVLHSLFSVFTLRQDIDWLLLTKRPERMRNFVGTPASNWDRDRGVIVAEVARHLGKIIWDPRGSNPVNYYGVAGGVGDVSNRRAFPGWPLPNVGVGTTVENDKVAADRIRALCDTPAAMRFLSCEPLFSKIPINVGLGGKIDWIIAGCESRGNRVGTADGYWDDVRDLQEGSRWAEAAFFHKQWPSVDGKKIEKLLHLCPPSVAERSWPKWRRNAA